ncbi:MAG: hypothetical protein E7503_06635 [Ruminococcus sp.]|nr:hypothetical protein [Ruminococcus sp.]
MKIDLRNPETWAALERQAYNGTVNLLPLPPAAYKYFAELTAVYRAFRFDGMAKEDAENRKRLLLKDYQRQVQEIYRAREVYAEYQNAIRTVGTLTAEIEKAQSVYEIAEKACTVIGLLTGDNGFYGRQIRKMQKCGEAEVIHARWIERETEPYGDPYEECSHCGEPRPISHNDYYHRDKIRSAYGAFCNCCGAKMDLKPPEETEKGESPC